MPTEGSSPRSMKLSRFSSAMLLPTIERVGCQGIPMAAALSRSGRVSMDQFSISSVSSRKALVKTGFGPGVG